MYAISHARKIGRTELYFVYTTTSLLYRKPRIRQAKGENLCLALEEVKMDGVKLINIGAEGACATVNCVHSSLVVWS